MGAYSELPIQMPRLAPFIATRNCRRGWPEHELDLALAVAALHALQLFKVETSSEVLM